MRTIEPTTRFRRDYKREKKNAARRAIGHPACCSARVSGRRHSTSTSVQGPPFDGRLGRFPRLPYSPRSRSHLPKDERRHAAARASGFTQRARLLSETTAVGRTKPLPIDRPRGSRECTVGSRIPPGHVQDEVVVARPPLNARVKFVSNPCAALTPTPTRLWSARFST